MTIEAPREEGYLQVSSKHQIYYAAYGNMQGIPVVVLHGGPGAGCSAAQAKCFDLSRFNVVLFDQRGAMRSKPFACMEDNTTQDSIEDIEQLRKHLNIHQWVVFGGSWGSLLGVLYGQAHPEACLGFVLRGIFLGRSQDLNLFEKHPLTEEFSLTLEESEREDLLSACYKRVMDPDPTVHMGIARSFLRYFFTRLNNPSDVVEKTLENDQFVLSFIRAVFHYAKHELFISPNQVLTHMDKISHLSAIIIHGAADRNCSPEQAVALHQQWEKSQLWMIENGGHAADGPAIASALVRAFEAIGNEAEGVPGL